MPGGERPEPQVPRLPELPARMRSWPAYRRRLVSAASAACPLLDVACRLPFPNDFDDLTSRVLRGHLVRGCKLYDATVALHKTGRGDVAHNLTRGLMELLINMDYLLHAPDKSAASRGFVCRSVSHLLRPVAYLEKQVAIPEDVRHPTREDLEAWGRGIRPIIDLETEAAGLLDRAGLLEKDQRAQEFLTSEMARELTLAWPASVKARATTPLAQTIYNVWFAESCVTLHANWKIMERHDLSMGDSYKPDLRWFFDNPDNLVGVTVVTLIGFAEQLLLIGGDEAKEVAEKLATIVAWVARADATWHASLGGVADS